jgi:predicted GNAT family acetyltransferase
MELVHEEDHSRFVLFDDSEFVGEVSYEIEGDLMLLLSAEVPREIRGQGYGKIVVRKTLEHIRDNGSPRVQPVCPFIAKFMMQHPEFQALRA